MLSFFGTELSRLVRTTLYRRNDSMGLFFSPVTIMLSYDHTIILLRKIRTKTCFYQFCIRFIVCYDRRRACATNYWPITDVISKPKVKIVEHDSEGLYVYVIRHIFIIPLQNQRNSKNAIWSQSPVKTCTFLHPLPGTHSRLCTSTEIGTGCSTLEFFVAGDCDLIWLWPSFGYDYDQVRYNDTNRTQKSWHVNNALGSTQFKKKTIYMKVLLNVLVVIVKYAKTWIAYVIGFW